MEIMELFSTRTISFGAGSWQDFYFVRGFILRVASIFRKYGILPVYLAT